MGNMPDSFYKKLAKKNKKWILEKYPILPKETKKIDSNGYVWILVNPRKRTWKREHHLIFEKYLKRKLLDNEIIHHRNGNKQDNRLENLQLLAKYNHCPGIETIHSEDICKLLYRIKKLEKKLGVLS